MTHIKKFNESLNEVESKHLLNGLIEIKDTLRFILKSKYDNDNNALEEQISWLENVIKSIK